MSKFNLAEAKNIEELLVRLDLNKIQYDKALVEKVATYSQKIHEGQKRLSGQLIYEHCLTVAGYVASLKLDEVSICAAMLHDSVEKGGADIDEIDELFGTEIAFIVEGLSKMRSLSKKKDVEGITEEFNNLMFSASEDVRIIIIRIAEKLHNLLSIDVLDAVSAESSARKCLYIYAPLSDYLGLGVIQREIEDRAFKIINPIAYKIVESKIEEFYKTSEDIIQTFENQVGELLSNYNVELKDFMARKKGIYSAYKKLKNKYMFDEVLNLDVALDNLKDIYASRIIVSDIETCYLVLGLIQSNFEVLQDEFEDYITNPKENGYRSIHILISFKGITLEVQIRTQEMHEFCEYGPASHISYKYKTKDKSLTWTKDLVEWKDNSKAKEKYKLEAFTNSIFCFTPKGLVIQLRKGSTPLDFAYKVHTRLGDRYQGALVNGKMVDKAHKLETGDVVEILKSKNINVTRDWLNIVTNPTTIYHVKKRLRELKLI